MKKKILALCIIVCLLLTSVFAQKNKSLSKFKTSDLDGNTISADIFAQADYTVLNVWGTFCPPCIAEMPELGQWAKNMPKGTQLLGLVVDVNNPKDAKAISKAKKILDGSDAKFLNLVANADFSNFLKDVMFVPTTFIIDSKGNVAASPIVGAKVDQYKESLKALLDGKQ